MKSQGVYGYLKYKKSVYYIFKITNTTMDLNFQ